MKQKTLGALALVMGAAAAAPVAMAAEWSDTSIGYRYGTKFAEPYNPEKIEKNILNLTHLSGYKYGTNFFNIDFLMSDGKENNAHEAYIVYRHTLDLGKGYAEQAIDFNGPGLLISECEMTPANHASEPA
ncbi:MAG: outer envelope protein [Rhodoferax sp.]|nr:outer envelope protein [Rhodoferax sp.]